jgi:undecaprenyl-phosphate 4-deoxy-4-formamido-L-arabinose transferase
MTATHREPELSVVVPVYRGAATVGRLVEALTGLAAALPDGLEIVLVDDGSPDDSAAVCRALVAASTAVPVVLVEHARNYGEHNAVMTGLRHARGRYIVTMDDDLQNPPEEVLRLLAHCRDNDLDVVYTRYARKEHALWRNLGSRFANKVADWLLDKPQGLYLSSFRCMNALVAGAIARYAGPYPYIDGLIMQTTQRIGSIEVRHLPRAEGRSNYTLRRLARLWLNLATSFSLLPLRLGILVGAAIAGLGFLGAAYVVYEALTGATPSGWASTMVVILLMGGAQFMLLGILGEYVGRTLLTAGGKPQAVIRRVHGEAARIAPGSGS